MYPLFGIYASVISGITFGLIISLLAVGLSLIYGILGTINTAHGAFYMVGGVLAYFASSFLGLNAYLSLIFALCVTFGLAMISMVAVVPKRLWVTKEGNEQSTVMILLMGLALVAQQIVFSVFGGSAFVVPSLANGYYLIPGGVYVTAQTLASVAIAISVYVVLYIFLRFSKLGMGMRAYAQDKEAAESVGIAGNRISFLAFAAGASMAGIAGVLLSSVYSVTSSSGWDQLIIAFVIVTFGGIGSIMGSMIAGLIYGIIYSVSQFYYPSLSFVIVLLAIYALMLIRPTGLLGQVVERG